MKRIAVITILSFLVLLATAQGTKTFNSESQLRYYLKENLLSLDPIEGIYDVEFVGGYVTSFKSEEVSRERLEIGIVSNDKSFSVYIIGVEGRKTFFLSDSFHVEPIGETNAYYFYCCTSAARIYLQDQLQFKARIILDDQSAFKYVPHIDKSVNLLVNYDCIKTYPTPSMYTEAARKRDEELSKPTEWTGSGFALNKGYIATNYHVVENARSIKVHGINGDFNKEYNANVVATDKYNDLALLSISDSGFSGFGSIPYRVKTTTSDVGKEVFVLGYPLTSTMGDEIKLTTGVVSSKTGFQGDISLYQISAAVQPGNSGGPLFDYSGNLIGIVSAKHKGAENVGYAVKASYLNNLVESVMSTNILPGTNNISNMPLTNKVKSLKNFVFMITCSSAAPSESPAAPSDSGDITSTKPANSQILDDEVHVYNPETKNSTGALELKEVIITSDKTILKFHYTNYFMTNGWCNIDPESYISVNGVQYGLKNVIGIAKSPQITTFTRSNTTLDFSLEFPAIPKSTPVISFTESISSGWNIQDIKLK
jgi:S1-C subfamily serine protease